MLEIITHAPNSHELRRDGVRVAVVDDWNEARAFAALPELLIACKELLRVVEDEAKALDAVCDNWPHVKMARKAIAEVVGRISMWATCNDCGKPLQVKVLGPDYYCDECATDDAAITRAEGR